jgi:signal transduction histidine kinase
MGSVRYTTEQAKRRNEELEKTTRLAQEADRQKTAFIQNVSHQIRTPLNIIMGFAQILKKSEVMLSDEDMKGITATMRHNAVLQKRLVAMLFDSSDTGLYKELNSHKHDWVYCNEVAREAIGYVNLYYANITVEFQTELDDDFRIQTNHTYLMISLRELLYNAVKYSDRQHVSMSITRQPTTVRFIVQDTGKGIDEADRERMFKFFVKVDDLSEGLGLGLPLSKRHAQNLGGDLTLDEDYHHGCRFIMELPITGSA